MQRPKGKTYMRDAIFAVYKGENMVAMGTARECAEELGVTPDYIRYMVLPAGKRRLASRKNPEKATTADVIDWE